MHSSVRLRPTCKADRDFLLRVYGSVREAELALVPWTEEQKAAFVRQQFEAQDSYYREQFQTAQFQVIEFDGKPIGRLYLHNRDRALHILDISLLPEARNKGIGTFLLKQIFQKGREQGKCVTIYVEAFNPAKHLYERLGFQKKESTSPVYEFMEWDATQK